MRRAFTLIELLVCVLVVAVLIGILLPSLASARTRAREVACAANLRQLWLETAAYVNDYRSAPSDGSLMVVVRSCPQARSDREEVAAIACGDYFVDGAGASAMSIKGLEAPPETTVWFDSTMRHRGMVQAVSVVGRVHFTPWPL